MVTQTNYFNTITDYGLSKLPAPMQEGHEILQQLYDSSGDWSVIDGDKDFKGMLDLQLQRLNELVKKKDAKPAKKPQKVTKPKAASPKAIPPKDGPHRDKPVKMGWAMTNTEGNNWPFWGKVGLENQGFVWHSSMVPQKNGDVISVMWNQNNNLVYAWIVSLEKGTQFKLYTIWDGGFPIQKKLELAKMMLTKQVSLHLANHKKHRLGHGFTHGPLTQSAKGYQWEIRPEWVRDLENGFPFSSTQWVLKDSKGRIAGGIKMTNLNADYEPWWVAVDKDFQQIVEGKANEKIPEVMKLVEIAQQAKVKTPTQPKPKTTSPGRKPAPKATRKPAPTKAPENLINEANPSLRILRRFRNFDGKDTTAKQFYNFIKALEQAILKQRIRKTDKHADLIRAIQDKSLGFWNQSLHDKEPETKVRIDLTPKLRQEVDEVLAVYAIRPSVRLINRYLLVQGQAPDPAKAQRLLDSITRAKVAKSDPYHQELTEVQKSLRDFLGGKTKRLEMQSQTLSGLQGILAGCGCGGSAVPQLAGLDEKIIPAFDQTVPIKPGELRALNFVSIPLPHTPMGAFLGNLDPNMLAIALTGDTTAGKSTFSFFLAKLFMEAGMSVKYFSLEEGVGPLTTNKLNLAGIADNDPMELVGMGDLAAIREAARLFDVVFIDSWSVLNENPEEYHKLREDFPNTVFVVIFQKTTTGTIRGGSRIIFDTPACINVYKEEGKRMAEMRKSRYGTQGWIYSITDDKITSK
ncbi:MAG: hypothetical protein H6581_20685 [Bacteroidia bacterium]|nr:hypothetical protein [Bacteroidia bacterium]